VKRFWKTQAWSLLLAMVLAIGWAQAVGAQTYNHAQAQASDPATVAAAFLAIYASDPEGTLALMTDDAVAAIVPPPPGTSGVWSGKEQLRQWNAFRGQQAASVQVIAGPQVEGNKVTMTVTVLVNDFRKWGLGPVEHTYEIVVEDGKVKSFTAIMAPSERAKVQAAAAAYFAANPPAGMPRTGQYQLLLLFVLFTAGALAVVAGLYARIRGLLNYR
jgi:hypothetical protein